MTRVQIPAYTDRWMMGDRYGEVVRLSNRRAKTLEEKRNGTAAIAHVRLDKSGKTVSVILDDCTVIEHG